MRWLFLFLLAFQIHAHEVCHFSSEGNETVKYTAVTGVVNDGGRSYFYSSPEDDCKGKLFLVPGDKIIVYKEYADYKFVSYLSKAGNFVSGWMKKDRLLDRSAGKAEISYADFMLQFNGVDFFLGDPISGVNKKLKRDHKADSYTYVGNSDGGNVYVLDYPDDKSTAIYFSSTNSSIRGDDEEVISQVTLRSSEYKTKRNISVGDTYDTVVKVYGYGNKDNDIVSYKYTDMILSFQFVNNKVVAITYYINPDFKE